MDSPFEQEIRKQVDRYLAGQISLNELRLWLMPLLWNIHRDDDLPAFQTAGKIALYISEYGAGHRTEQELRGLLASMLLAPPTH